MLYRSLQTASTEHTSKIATNTDAILKKADDLIIFEVDALTTKLREIEEIQKKEEDFGISVRIHINQYVFDYVLFFFLFLLFYKMLILKIFFP